MRVFLRILLSVVDLQGKQNKHHAVWGPSIFSRWFLVANLPVAAPPKKHTKKLPTP